MSHWKEKEQKKGSFISYRSSGFSRRGSPIGQRTLREWVVTQWRIILWLFIFVKFPFRKTNDPLIPIDHLLTPSVLLWSLVSPINDVRTTTNHTH